MRKVNFQLSTFYSKRSENCEKQNPFKIVEKNSVNQTFGRSFIFLDGSAMIIFLNLEDFVTMTVFDYVAFLPVSSFPNFSKLLCVLQPSECLSLYDILAQNLGSNSAPNIISWDTLNSGEFIQRKGIGHNLSLYVIKATKENPLRLH